MIQPAKIHLISINLFKANLNTSNAYLDTPEKPATFDFGFEKEVAHHFEAEQIRLRLFFHLSALNKQAEKLGIEVEYGLEFFALSK